MLNYWLRKVCLLLALFWFVVAISVVLDHELTPIVAFLACIVAGAGSLAVHKTLEDD